MGLAIQYRQEIKQLEKKIDSLNVPKNPTLENITERNLLLSKIGDLRAKLNHLSFGRPANGYGHVMSTYSILTDKPK